MSDWIKLKVKKKLNADKIENYLRKTFIFCTFAAQNPNY